MKHEDWIVRLPTAGSRFDAVSMRSRTTPATVLAWKLQSATRNPARHRNASRRSRTGVVRDREDASDRSSGPDQCRNAAVQDKMDAVGGRTIVPLRIGDKQEGCIAADSPPCFDDPEEQNRVPGPAPSRLSSIPLDSSPRRHSSDGKQLRRAMGIALTDAGASCQAPILPGAIVFTVKGLASPVGSSQVKCRMKCFHHIHTDAVGLCKACSKGLCEACAVDVGGGLACRQGCSQAVKDLNNLIARNLRITASKERTTYVGPLFLIVLGVGFALDPLVRRGRAEPFPIIMGGLFVAFGAILVLLNHKARTGN
jgi:hypothetical protein